MNAKQGAPKEKGIDKSGGDFKAGFQDAGGPVDDNMINLLKACDHLEPPSEAEIK
jgi:hypothetical protein